MVGPLPAHCPGSRLPTVAAFEVGLAWARCPLPSVGRAGAEENGEKNGPGMGRGSRWSLRGPGVALDLG